MRLLIKNNNLVEIISNTEKKNNEDRETKKQKQRMDREVRGRTMSEYGFKKNDIWTSRKQTDTEQLKNKKSRPHV